MRKRVEKKQQKSGGIKLMARARVRNEQTFGSVPIGTLVLGPL